MSTEETIRRLIAYFRGCLLSDGGDRQIISVFGRDEREPHLFASPPEEWATLGPVPVTAGYATRVQSILQTHQQERELLVGTCLVTGAAQDAGGRQRRVRSPLLLYEATLATQDAGHAVYPDPGSVRINPIALDALGLAMDEVGVADDPDIERLLEKLATVTRRDHVDDASQLSTWRRGQEPYWMGTGVVWLTVRSQLARSVAYELKELARPRSQLSRPLRKILGEQAVPPDTSATPMPQELPACLTPAQEQCIRAAARERISVINGPPGTGKTYVLACQALDRVLCNERALIVCSNEHAADVVRGKLTELFSGADDLLVRAGRGNYQRELVARLDKLLAGEATPAPGHQSRLRLHAKLVDQAAGVARMEKRFRVSLKQAVSDGATWRAEALPHRVWRRWRRRRLRRAPLLSERWQQLQGEVAAHRRLAYRHLRALATDNMGRLLQHKRRALTQLTAALRSQSSGRRKERFQQLDWEVLTQAFPIWVVSAQALHRVLPPQAELFDFVIIDEATQCNLALALPALQRAARAVVVGDPKQLRHFSFLSRTRQRALAQRYEVEQAPVDLDYRTRSLVDYGLAAASSDDAVTLLDEHFRSHPTLIGFSNDRFYDGRLRVLTDARAGDDPPPVAFVDCSTRLEGDINAAEVEAVLSRLDHLIADAAEIPDHEAPSIGVVAFFRSTALRIEQELLARFDLVVLGRHGLRVGTPYAFQGEERDTILLATGVYPGRAAAAWTYLNRPDVFNVAITRARHRQIVFVAAGAVDANSTGLLAEYRRYVTTHSPDPAPPAPEIDGMRAGLVAALESNSVHCHPDYPLAGHRLDLLATGEGKAVGIDTVGSGVAAGTAWSTEDYRVLERAGLDLFPVAFTEWHDRRNDVLAGLSRKLGAPVTTPELDGRQAQSLRWRLGELRDRELLAHLERLEEAYRGVVHWLQSRFDPGEVTYQRYEESADRLRHAAVTELEGAVVLFEGLRDTAPEVLSSRLKEEVHERMERCRRAVNALNELAGELALLRTDRPDLEEALDEVGRLAERVPQYGPPDRT